MYSDLTNNSTNLLQSKYTFIRMNNLEETLIYLSVNFSIVKVPSVILIVPFTFEDESSLPE